MPFDTRFQWLTSIKSENYYIASDDKTACQTGTKTLALGKRVSPGQRGCCVHVQPVNTSISALALGSVAQIEACLTLQDENRTVTFIGCSLHMRCR